MNNKLVIAVLIAACFVEVLSTRTVVRSRKRTARTAPAKASPTKRTQPVTKPIPNETLKINKSKSTDGKSTALAEIPYLSSDKDTLIKGVDGKISVNGVLLYEDDKFKNGQVCCKVIENNVYLNGNLVAKSPQDGSDSLQNPNINNENIKNFVMKIHKVGIIEYSHDGLPSSWWM